MAYMKWYTPSGLIGTFVEESTVEFQLDARVDGIGNAVVSYTQIAGNMTNGLELYETGPNAGIIYGIPVIETISIVQQNFVQTFTIRAQATAWDGTVYLADRTFSVAVNTIALPQIVPKDVDLGSFYDGTYINDPLVATDPNPMAVLEWTLVGGVLPLGLTLTSLGRLFGYLEPYVPAGAESIINWDMPPWDINVWDNEVPLTRSMDYRFTVQVFDGSRYDRSTYTMHVESKAQYTVDHMIPTADADENAVPVPITADIDNWHDPFIVTLPQTIPDQRAGSNFAFQIIGRDLDGASLEYVVYEPNLVGFDQGPDSESPWIDNAAPFDSTGFSLQSVLPPGVTLDINTGWLTGNLETQIEERKTYTFKIFCVKQSYPLYESDMVEFTFTVLGEMNNTISWITPTDLGIIDNGAISELSIQAVSSLGKTLNYRFKEGDAPPGEYWSRIPMGLELLPSGLIVGRVSFEYFQLDGGTTTFDNNTLEFDSIYVFTVTATDDTTIDDPTVTNGTVSGDRTFQIRVNNYNIKPYENLYLRALPTFQQRVDFMTLMNDASVFPDQLIYRIDDPWFGKSENIKFLFAAGMEPNLAADYIAAMEFNHYNKRISLGNVKTAVALDVNYNIKYEVVYVEVIDADTVAGKSVAKHIDRRNQVSSPYLTAPYIDIYPNSLDNMKSEVTALGYANRGAMPDWMLNQQEDGSVLGFTRGVVLAYTVPGAGKLIAYRLQQYDLAFNTVDFVADRYQLDHLLSKNYNVAAGEFYPPVATTFDTATTTFDSGATRFVSGLDLYAPPETDDIWLKFPQDNIYQ